MKKILIIDDLHPSIVEMLSSIQFSCDYFPYTKREELFNLKDEYCGILVRSKTYLDAPIFDHLTKLQFIGRAGAGVDLIDLEEVEKRKIQLINAPEGNRDALAEHALAILLGIMNFTTRGHQEIDELLWKREANRGYELGGLTVGLVGYGFMGQAFAKRLKAIGCTILAYDKYKTRFSDEFVKESTMDEIYAQADVFTIHTPLTSETKYLLSDEFFNSFTKPIWFTNTSRGPILDTQALLTAMHSGKVLGAALDVLENEKPKTWTPAFRQLMKDLYATNKFTITPHVGGWTFESYYKINEVLVDKITKLILN